VPIRSEDIGERQRNLFKLKKKKATKNKKKHMDLDLKFKIKFEFNPIHFFSKKITIENRCFII